MALIQNSNPKGNIKNSGYYRLTGNNRMARLYRAGQSTVITNGTELEHHLEKFSPYTIYKTEWTNISPKTGNVVKTRYKVPNTTPTLSDIFQKLDNNENCFFPKIKISREELKSYDVDLKSKKHIELDGVWIYNGTIYITEMKDGSDFDTKKSDGEIEMFKKMKKVFNGYDHKMFIVLWNLDDVNNNSVKSLEAKKYLKTGQEFSELIGLDFEGINQERTKDQKDNMEYLISEMKEIIKEYETNN
tara:strand:- start:2000 stop:2734 length:735 start_codon:yes stop_codon:yes gene_type:complete